MIKYYDIGVNLFCRQFTKPEKILSDANQAGVACILTGSDMRENEKIHRFVQCHDAWGTAGIHPHNANDALKEDFDRLEEILAENYKIVAVGECGLDFDRMFSTRENQIRCLEKHIVLAEKMEKPLFLHERDASSAFISIFKRHPEICKNAVVHCFTGDKKTLETYLEMGFYIGITGWICDDRRASALRKAVEILPKERVMLETDAPYLIPRNVSGIGRINFPANIQYVARTLAEYMHISEEELLLHARQNTEKFFGIHAGGKQEDSRNEN
ncbi:MAG: TatD family hydrolase [Oscillospiraceae bacterium]|nr:TatD family hydrolase [Oscillospiraceae bacterium]